MYVDVYVLSPKYPPIPRKWADDRYELQRRVDLDTKLHGISILALDPGGMPGTGMVRDSPFYIRFILGSVLPLFLGIINYLAPSVPFRKPKRSGGDLLRVALDEEEVGKYPKAVNFNGRVVEDTSPETRDERKQKELWEGSLSLAGIKEGDTVLENWK